ncbi:ATP/ADP-dependent (S)-NAD(P)H-hydrate dehydratase [Dillenia turbinata]|uniref:ATP-dependent (S)-NAD(P)H-hydrate dehydratase n=1 Tax=Dillenia turbinata TaxID=194707 RepID=A0AAN8VLT6_9MAGN
MKSVLNFCNGSSNLMFSTSAVIRRQHFLILTFANKSQSHHRTIMQETKCMCGSNSLEADAENILRTITPKLDLSRHKGQAGKIAVVGGCHEYTGAPYFAAISALKIGADLSHVFCTKEAATVIKTYSPELIVHPVLEESYSVRDEDRKSVLAKVLAEVDKWMERFDCLVIGPGLGRDPFLLDCVSEIMKHAREANVPIVVDGGYPLAVLTPSVNEYKRLIQKVLNCEVNNQDAPEQLLSLARQIGGVTILQKGKSDLISDGETVKSVSIFGSPRRCGGQGDILSGRFCNQLLHLNSKSSEPNVAVFLSWAQHFILASEGNLSVSPTNATFLGCIAGAALLREAASLAFANNKRATLTGNIINRLGRRCSRDLEDTRKTVSRLGPSPLKNQWAAAAVAVVVATLAEPCKGGEAVGCKALDSSSLELPPVEDAEVAYSSREDPQPELQQGGLLLLG